MLDRNEISSDGVALHRFTDGTGWQPVATERVGETETGHRYRAEFDGLSLFAVGTTDAEGPATSIEAAVAGEDGVVDTVELLDAIDRWSTGEPVPGTDGETISTPEILELIELWATAEPVS